MKVKIAGNIYKPTHAWEGRNAYDFFSFDATTAGDYILVCPHEFEVEIPDTFDPVSAEVDLLNKKIESIQKESDLKVLQIQQRISSLLCIENNPSGS